MGLLWGKRAAKAEAAAEVDAWVAGAGAALPGAQLSAESWAGRRYGAYGVFHTYTVQVRGNRSEFPAVVGRLTASIDALKDGDRLNLQIARPEASGAVSSRLLIAGEKRERAWVHFLVQAHDALAARIPGESLLIDGVSGRFNVLELSREEAVPTARELMSWWADLLATESERWPLTGLSLEIGGSPEDPEITYTLDLPGRFDSEVRDPEPGESAAPRPAAGTREWIRQVDAAWTAGLSDLESVTQQPLRPGDAVEFEFRTPAAEVRLIVLERNTDVWNAGNKENTALRFTVARKHNPASQ